MTQKKSLLTSISLATLLFICSRVLGLIRDTFLASTLGFTLANDLLSKTFRYTTWIRDFWKNDIFISSIDNQFSSFFNCFFSSVIYLWIGYILFCSLLFAIFNETLLIFLIIFSSWIFGEWICFFSSCCLKDTLLKELDLLFSILKNIFWLIGISICFFFNIKNLQACFIILTLSSFSIFLQIFISCFLIKQTPSFISFRQSFPIFFKIFKASLLTIRTFLSERIRSFWLILILSQIQIDGFFSHFFFFDRFISLPIIFLTYMAQVFLLNPSSAFYKNTQTIHSDLFFFIFWGASFFLFYLTGFLLYYPKILSLILPSANHTSISQTFLILFCMQTFLVFISKMLFIISYSCSQQSFYEKISWLTLLLSMLLSSPILFFKSFNLFFISNILSYLITLIFSLHVLSKRVQFHFSKQILPFLLSILGVTVVLSSPPLWRHFTFFWGLFFFICLFFIQLYRHPREFFTSSS